MARREGNRLLLEGAVNMDTVAALVPVAERLVREGVELVDLAAVTEVDSAAVALALTLTRAAGEAGRTIAFVNLPSAMSELARLYGVADFVRLG